MEHETIAVNSDEDRYLIVIRIKRIQIKHVKVFTEYDLNEFKIIEKDVQYQRRDKKIQKEVARVKEFKENQKDITLKKIEEEKEKEKEKREQEKMIQRQIQAERNQQLKVEREKQKKIELAKRKVQQEKNKKLKLEKQAQEEAKKAEKVDTIDASIT